VVPHCVFPCACWGSAAESISKRKSCSSATCSYLILPNLAVIFSCDRLNWNRLGIQQRSLDFLWWCFCSLKQGKRAKATGKWQYRGTIEKARGSCSVACLPTYLSVFLVSEPNDESGANVDASKMWREDREQFNKIAKQIVQKSLGL